MKRMFTRFRQRRPFRCALPALALAAMLAGCGGDPGERALRKGRAAMADGEWVAARAEFEKAVARSPGDAATQAALQNLLGIVEVRLGNPDAAVEAFQDSRRLHPEFMDPAYNLGVLYDQTGEPYKAQAYLEDAALIDINNPLALEYLADMHMRASRWEEAREVLIEALERAPGSGRLRTRLALVELPLSGPQEAVSYLMQALEKDSSYAPALYNLAVISHVHLDQPDQAAAYFRQYLDEAPDGPRAQTARAYLEGEPPDLMGAAAGGEPAATGEAIGPDREGSGQDVLALAREKAEAGESREALTLCMRAAARARGNPEAREAILRQTVDICFDQARAHLEWGRFLLEQDRAAEALSVLKRAAALDDASLAVHLALARAAMARDEVDTALVSLRKAVALDPAEPDTLWRLAQLYDAGLGMTNRAVRAYTDFADRFPQDPRVLKARDRIETLAPEPPEADDDPSPDPPSREPAAPSDSLNLRSTSRIDRQAAAQAYQRAKSFLNQQDWDRAIYHYKRAVENNPGLVNAYYNLGVAYQQQGDATRAADAYREALKRNPRMSNARYNLALIQYRRDQTDPAIDQLNKLLERDPDYAGAHYLLGMLRAAQPGREAEARQHYRRYLDLEPNGRLADQARRWLERTQR